VGSNVGTFVVGSVGTFVGFDVGMIVGSCVGTFVGFEEFNRSGITRDVESTAPVLRYA